MPRRRAALLLMLVLGMLAPWTTFATSGASAAPTGPPRVSIGAGSVVEGLMTRRYIRFTVALSWPSTSTVSVQFGSADGTATVAGHDYKAKAGTINFRPGQTSKTPGVLVWPDLAPEGDETFTVQLSNPTNATLGVATGIGTIIDDDPNVGDRVSLGDTTVPESCFGRPVQAVVVMTLSRGLGSPEVVSVQTSPGSAQAGADYTSYSKTITFTAAQNLKEIKIPIPPDTAMEGDEQFTVALTVVSGSAKALRSTGTVTIRDCAPAA